MSHLLKSSIFTSDKANMFGVLASGLCLIHCLATPFLFVTKMCSDTCCSEAPAYWQWIDYTFLIVSLIAVYYSVINSSKNIIKIALWISWVCLFLVLLNEKILIVQLPNYTIYIPALALIVFHLYNRRYCQCSEKECCS